MDKVELGPDHPAHQRIAWAEDEWKHLHPIIILKSFIPHLSHNKALSSVDINQVKDFRAALAAENEREAIEIQELSSKPASLQERALIRKKTFLVCNILLSPFRYLPYDVLHEIAGHCHPDQEWERKPRRNGHTPTNLAATCSTWRTVIHNMPSLWQSISIDCDRYVSCAKPSTALSSQIDHFARRAQNLPLTIHCVDGEAESLRKHIIEWIFCHWEEGSRNRLQQLHIHPYKCLNWLDETHRIHEEAYTLPSVQTLIITDSRRGANYQTHLSTMNFSVICSLFPNLHRIWVGGQPVHFEFPPSILNPLSDATVNGSFSNITHLFLADLLDIDVWNALLRALPNLKCGVFKLDGTEESLYFPPSFHVVPNLRHLALTFFGFSSTHILQPFVKLLFPELSILYIQFVHEPPADFYPEDNRFSPTSFSNPFPSLHTMQIYTYARDGDWCDNGFTGLYHLFLAAPSLTTLAVYVADKDDFVGVANFLLKDQQGPLPNLEVFEMLLEGYDTTNNLIEIITESLLGTLTLPSSSIKQANPLQVPARNHFISSGVSIQYKLDLSYNDEYVQEILELGRRLREDYGFNISIEHLDTTLDTYGLIWDLPDRKNTVEEWFMSQF